MGCDCSLVEGITRARRTNKCATLPTHLTFNQCHLNQFGYSGLLINRQEIFLVQFHDVRTAISAIQWFQLESYHSIFSFFFNIFYFCETSSERDSKGNEDQAID